MYSLPTSVFFVWPIPKDPSMPSRIVSMYWCFFSKCSGLSRGILFLKANFIALLTVKVGKWMSSEVFVRKFSLLRDQIRYLLC